MFKTHVIFRTKPQWNQTQGIIGQRPALMPQAVRGQYLLAAPCVRTTVL